MKWLVTAFEPFDQAQSNSSLTLWEELKSSAISDLLVFEGPVPVTFAGAWETVSRAITKHPDVGGVLALGQAETRPRISLERVALNWIDARIPDNSGQTYPQQKITEGPDVLWSPIPWEQLPAAPAWERSYSAGTFVCNALMFHLCQWAKNQGKLAGFVHTPLLTSQTEPKFAASPKMDHTQATAALKHIMEFLIRL